MRSCVTGLDDHVDLTQLPPEFHDLIPLMNEWAIADDEERDQKMHSASDEQLRELTDRVRPRFGPINSYLDDSAHLEVAPYLDRLAEAAVEAQLDLEKPGRIVPLGLPLAANGVQASDPASASLRQWFAAMP